MVSNPSSRISTVSTLLERTLMRVHRHEKRHGRVLDKRKFACAIAKSTPGHIRFVDPPKLMFELTWQYCISCNMPHWILGDEIEIDEITTNRSRFHGWMQKVGYE